MKGINSMIELTVLSELTNFYKKDCLIELFDKFAETNNLRIKLIFCNSVEFENSDTDLLEISYTSNLQIIEHSFILPSQTTAQVRI